MKVRQSISLKWVLLGYTLFFAVLLLLLAFLLAPKSTLSAIGLMAETVAKNANAVARKVEAAKGSNTVESVFTPIDVRIEAFPRARRPGNGGALTLFDDKVLLVDFAGDFFVATQTDKIRRLGLRAPNNGFDTLREYINGETGSAFEFNPHVYRYNDLTFVDTEKFRGLVLSYTYFDKAKVCTKNRVAMLAVSNVDALLNDALTGSDWRVVYDALPCLPLKNKGRAVDGHMAGGKIAHRNDGYIYLANGDYGWDGEHGEVNVPERIATGTAMSQDPQSHYGKVMRINLSDGSLKIVSSGHRNMQGMVFDEQNRLWVVEHGARGGDELNLVVEGANFGWPKVSLGTAYSGAPLKTVKQNDIGFHRNFNKPAIAFLPSIGTSALSVSSGFHPAWEGDLLIGTLSSEELVRIRLDGDRAVFTEFIPIGRRIRDLDVSEDGTIILWTDTRELMFLTPAGARLSH